MSLATRCTACGTIFRVVQDQLKVSEGWVRCGRCDAVFNAMQGLFDLERDAPPEWPAPPLGLPQEPQGPQTSTASAPASAFAPAFAPAAPHYASAPATAYRASETYSNSALAVTQPIPAADSQTVEPQTVDFQAVDPVLSVAPGEPGQGEPHPEAAAFSDFAAAEQTSSSPDFIRHADDARRWKRSGARLALAFAVLLALLGLGAQVTHHFRDTIAARLPQTKSALVTACAWVPCQVGLPRRIDDLAVENTSLTHTIPGSDAFKLTVSLRNRGSFAVALPSVDLSLTDATGQLVARRALAPRDFSASAAGLNSGADTTLSLMLSASDKKVTGYTVEVFYP
jgi:predicted Zn finger-like uncharacterized protein